MFSPENGYTVCPNYLAKYIGKCCVTCIILRYIKQLKRISAIYSTLYILQYPFKAEGWTSAGVWLKNN